MGKRSGFAALFVILVLLYFIPSLISYKTQWGNASMQSLKLSWFGPQKIRVLVVKEGSFLFTAEDAELDISLFKLVFKKITAFKCSGGRLTHTELPDAAFENIALDYKQNAFLILDAQTRLGEKEGNLTARADYEEDDWIVNANAVNVPVPIMKENFGDFLNLQMNGSFGKSGLCLNLNLESPKFKAIAHTTSDGNLLVTELEMGPLLGVDVVNMSITTQNKGGKLLATGAVSPIILKENASLENTQITLEWDIKTKNAHLIANLEPMVQKVPAGQMYIAMRTSSSGLYAQAKASHLSALFIQIASGMKESLVPIIGPSVDIIADTDNKKLHFEAVGSKLNLKGAILQNREFDLTATTLPKGQMIASGILDKKKQKIEGSFKQFPSAILNILNTNISTILGDTLDATIKLDVENQNGTINFNVNAPATKASLDGQIKEGILTLNEPFYAQVTVTPELSSLLLKTTNPLSLSSFSADHPLSCEIAHTGFTYPLYAFDPSKLNVSKAHIELGRLHCRNEGNLSTTLGLLKFKPPSRDLNLWFTPIDFQINQGKLDLERTDVLIADAYDTAFWGKLDFVENKVNMILGLTAECLKKAFGIQNLPEDYVLQIPMKGTLDNVQINTTTATTKIAALMVWQQQGLANKGAAGAILGEFAGKLGILPDKSVQAPPPKRPFPWEKEKKKISHSKKKKAIHKKDKPLKQFIKVLKS